MARKQKQVHFENVELTAGGGEGHAIGKINGKVVFVKYGAPGDVADIRIIGRKKKYSIARIEKLHRPSELRTEPFCEHYGLCGGCRWQHLRYSAQKELKDQWAQDCLTRIGKVEVKEFLPIKGSQDESGYRNKMEYTFSNKRWLYEDEDIDTLPHTNALGFHAPGRFDKVIEIKKCHLQDTKGNEIRNAVQQFCLDKDFTFYDLKEQHGFARNLMLRNTVEGDWMVCLLVAEDDQQKIKAVMEFIKETFNPASLNYAINTKRNDSIYDLDFVNYSGNPHITETLCGQKFKIHPKSFFQTNTKQAEVLYETAMEFAGLAETDVVYDLYCGTGTISCVAAKKAKHVVGVELIEEAILSARRNATNNGLSNTSFVVGDMKDVFNSEFYSKHGQPDVIITDPPRAGMHPKVVDYLLEIEAPKIVYVSCNPATQARDLAILDAKYMVIKSQAVDMFPQTHHVENVVLLERKS